MDDLELCALFRSVDIINISSYDPSRRLIRRHHIAIDDGIALSPPHFCLWDVLSYGLVLTLEFPYKWLRLPS